MRTQEVVIVGYQPGQGRRAGTIGALLLAVTGPDGHLHYAGGVGTGFTDAALRPDKNPAETFGPNDTAPTASAIPTTAGLTGTATVAGSMHTADGAWQVDIMQRNHSQWYRITHGANVFDWLAVDAVQQILRDAGIDLADLTEPQSPKTHPDGRR